MTPERHLANARAGLLTIRREINLTGECKQLLGLLNTTLEELAALSSEPRTDGAIRTVAGQRLLAAVGGTDEPDYQSPTANMIVAIEAEARTEPGTGEALREALLSIEQMTKPNGMDASGVPNTYPPATDHRIRRINETARAALSTVSPAAPTLTVERLDEALRQSRIICFPGCRGREGVHLDKPHRERAAMLFASLSASPDPDTEGT